jgi:hypothetical protein
MTATTSPQSVSVATLSHGKSLALISAISLVCGALAFGVGWLQGGQSVAVEALVGMACAAAGAWVAWAIVALTDGPNTAATAAPMLGLMVRVFVTGAAVGFAVVGFGFDKRPVLFAALFGYLVLMATETILLYRFASYAGPSGRPSETTDAEQATEPDR